MVVTFFLYKSIWYKQLMRSSLFISKREKRKPHSTYSHHFLFQKFAANFPKLHLIPRPLLCGSVIFALLCSLSRVLIGVVVNRSLAPCKTYFKICDHGIRGGQKPIDIVDSNHMGSHMSAVSTSDSKLQITMTMQNQIVFLA